MRSSYSPYTNVNPLETSIFGKTSTTNLPQSYVPTYSKGTTGASWEDDDWASSLGTSWDNYYGKNLASINNTPAIDTTIGGNTTPTPAPEPSWFDSLMGRGSTNLELAKTAQNGAFLSGHLGLDVFNGALGLASYLQQADTAKKQGKLLDQKIAENIYQRENREARKAAYNALPKLKSYG